MIDLDRLRQIDVGRLLGRSPRQIRNLLDRGLPSHVDSDSGKRYYSGPEVVAWWGQYLLEEALPDEGEEELDPKDRFDLARAQLAELELAEKRRQILPVPYVLDQISRIAEALRAKIVPIPGKYAARFVGLKRVGKAQALLADLVTDLLSELAEVGSDVEALDDEENAA